MAKYHLGDKEVTEEEFYKAVNSAPFYLDEVINGFNFFSGENRTDDEILKTLSSPHLKGSELREEWKTTTVDMSKAKGENVLEGAKWNKFDPTPVQKEKIDKLKSYVLNSQKYNTTSEINDILNAKSEEELETILKRDMSIGAPNWQRDNTGGTVFEKVQESSLANLNSKQDNAISPMDKHLKFLTDQLLYSCSNTKIQGKKENKNKPQLSILFKQFPKALEAITKCSEYGNSKYKDTDKDFLNFKRVEGGSKTYADAGLRHRLETGLDESGLPHQFHVAWNAIAELELWIKENNK